MNTVKRYEGMLLSHYNEYGSLGNVYAYAYGIMENISGCSYTDADTKLREIGYLNKALHNVVNARMKGVV